MIRPPRQRGEPAVPPVASSPGGRRALTGTRPFLRTVPENGEAGRGRAARTRCGKTVRLASAAATVSPLNTTVRPVVATCCDDAGGTFSV